MNYYYNIFHITYYYSSTDVVQEVQTLLSITLKVEEDFHRVDRMVLPVTGVMEVKDVIVSVPPVREVMSPSRDLVMFEGRVMCKKDPTSVFSDPKIDTSALSPSETNHVSFTVTRVEEVVLTVMSISVGTRLYSVEGLPGLSNIQPLTKNHSDIMDLYIQRVFYIMVDLWLV